MSNNILNIREMAVFLESMKTRFLNYIEDKRFFRITGTPMDFTNVKIDNQESDVIELLRKPPVTRKNGWTLEVPDDFKLTLEGIENMMNMWRHIILLRNGHFEFWAGIEESFCWMQNKQEIPRHPRLYPYAVIEYPANFFRVLKKLTELKNIHSDYWITAGYFNCMGCYMRPGHPKSIMFQDPTIYKPRYWTSGPHVEIKERAIPNDFEPDNITYELVVELYSAFGIEKDDIPFFDENHKLIIK